VTEKRELTPEELERENGEELPERQAMSIVDPNPDIPVFPVDTDPYEVENDPYNTTEED
jgi:hypothetical protein